MSNTIQIKGNLGRDGEQRFTKSGASVLNLNIADQARRKTEQGWEDDGPATWYRVSVWGALGEALAESGAMVKGAAVAVTGELRPREYEKDGQMHTSMDVRAESVGVFPKRSATPQPQPQQQPDPWSTGATNDEPPF